MHHTMDMFSDLEPKMFDLNLSKFIQFIWDEKEEGGGGGGGGGGIVGRGGGGEGGAVRTKANWTGDRNGTMDLADMEPLNEFEMEFHRVINILHTYVLPVIILIGIIGNTVS